MQRNLQESNVGVGVVAAAADREWLVGQVFVRGSEERRCELTAALATDMTEETEEARCIMPCVLGRHDRSAAGVQNTV